MLMVVLSFGPHLYLLAQLIAYLDDLFNKEKCTANVLPAGQDVLLVLGELADQVVDHARAHAHLGVDHDDGDNLTTLVMMMKIVMT